MTTISPQAVRVMKALAEGDRDVGMAGYDIMKQAGISSANLYTGLAELMELGLVEWCWRRRDNPEIASEWSRNLAPPDGWLGKARKYYRLTSDGRLERARIMAEGSHRPETGSAEPATSPA